MRRALLDSQHHDAARRTPPRVKRTGKAPRRPVAIFVDETVQGEAAALYSTRSETQDDQVRRADMDFEE